MIGVRVGIRAGINAGIAVGISADEVGGGGGGVVVPSVDIAGGSYGQSNNNGEADAGNGGTPTTSGADGGYNPFISGGFTGSLQRLYYAQALTTNSVQNYVDTGTTPGQPYAPSGQANLGFWLPIAKTMVQYGGYGKVGIGTHGSVLGASLRRQLGVSAAFPVGAPTNLYQNHIARLIADIAIWGRSPSWYLFVQGESDATDATDAAQYQANLTALIAAVRAALGLPTLLFVIIRLNSAVQPGSFIPQIQAAQDAVAAGDPNVLLINPDRYPLKLTNIHYASNEVNDLGALIAFKIMRFLRPGFIGNLSAGPAPWLQQMGAAQSAQASPATSIPRDGPDPQDGDYEYMVAAAYFAVGATITLTTPAGFTAVANVTSNFPSASPTNQRQAILYERPVTAAILAANNGHMPDPVVDFGTATLSFAKIFCPRGPNKWTSSPLASTSVGAANANSTALTIAAPTATPVNNCLVMLFMFHNGLNNGLTSITNASLTGITTQWDMTINPGAGTVGMSMATATVPVAGAIAATTVAFKLAAVGAGILAVIKP